MIDTNFIIPLTQTPAVSELSSKSSQGITSVSDDNKNMSFADTLRGKIQEVKDLEMASLDSAYAVSLGQSEDIEGAMIDSAKASVAIETAVQITTRVVNAYKEIMQMQI